MKWITSQIMFRALCALPRWVCVAPLRIFEYWGRSATNKQTNKSCRINKHLVCNKRDRHSVFVQPNQSSNHLDLSFWSYRRPKSHRQKNLCQWSFRNVKQIICDSRRIAADMWAAGESAMSNDQLMTCNGAHHSTFLLIRVSTRAEREPFSG